MKAFKKLMAMLLLMTMCLSVMAAPACATYDESLIVGRVTADMMGEEPAVEPAEEAPAEEPAAEEAPAEEAAAEEAAEEAPAEEPAAKKAVKAVLI